MTRPEEIDPEAAREYFDEGRAVFIDARPADEYVKSAERIPGALPVGPGSGIDILEALKSLPREKLIIAYCDEPNQAASAQIARRVRELGLGDGSFLSGGFRAWKEKGLPIEPNPDVPTAAEPQATA